MRCECELDFHTSPFQEICLLKNPSENKNPFIWNFSWKKIIFFDLLTLVPLYRMTYADLQQSVAAASSHFEMHLLIFFFAEGKAYLHSMKTCMNATVWMSYSISAAWRRTKKNNYQFKSYFFCSKVHFLRGILHWTAPKHHLDN